MEKRSSRVPEETTRKNDLLRNVMSDTDFEHPQREVKEKQKHQKQIQNNESKKKKMKIGRVTEIWTATVEVLATI